MAVTKKNVVCYDVYLVCYDVYLVCYDVYLVCDDVYLVCYDVYLVCDDVYLLKKVQRFRGNILLPSSRQRFRKKKSGMLSIG